MIIKINQIYVIGRLDDMDIYLNMSLKLKLTDFIDDDHQERIIMRINEMYSSLHYSFKLKLWYDEGEIKPKELKSFIQKWESALQYKTIIKPTAVDMLNDFTWFDITPDTNTAEYQTRFRYVYPEGYHWYGILNGLDEFESVAKFCTTEKPPKRKQKRNDYENERNREQ